MTPTKAMPLLSILRAHRSVLRRLPVFWEVWPILGFALAFVLVYLRASPVFGLPFDDSYISLLFARNLAHHGFLTFNGETASAGATSLLHVLILALPIKLGLDPVRASVGMGIVLHVELVLAVYWLAWTIFRDRLTAAVSGASASVIGYLVFDALNGMETTLFLLTVVAAATALLSGTTERGFLAAGVLGGLAVLTRPEGVLFVGAMVLYYLLNPGRGAPALSLSALQRMAFLAGPALLALVGLAAFYNVTTGSPMPGTATAKMLFFREFELSPQTKFDWAQGGLANFIGPVVPWLALAALGIRRRETLLFVFFWVAFVLIYYVLFPGGMSHYWYRYQHGFLPAIAVFGSAGLVALLRSRELRGWNLASAGIVAVVLLGYVLFQYNSFRNHYAEDVRITEKRQVRMALYLRDLVRPGGTIATHDIGAIGFFSDRRVIDLVGLVEPDVVDYHEGRRLREYIDQVQPDYIVVFPSWEDSFLRLGLKENAQLFELVRVFADAAGEPFVVYKTHYDHPSTTKSPARSIEELRRWARYQ